MEKINTLLNNKLHDAEITSLSYKNNNLYIKVDCEGMNLEEYLPNLDNIYFTIECINVNKLDFEFDSMILIDELTIEKEDKVIIKVLNGDLYLECDDYKIIDVTETPKSKRSKEDIMLENILKSNI